MKSSNSKNQDLELHIPLPKSFKVCKERGKQSEENRGKLAAVFFCTFGALTEVHFLHSIYHFKAQEVKNPMLQTVRNSELKRRSYSHCKSITLNQPNFEDFSSEDERLSFLSLGVRKSGHPLVISCELEKGSPRLKIILNVTGTPFLYEESEPSDLNSKKHLFFVINFVDYSLNQGAPAGHESAETPIGPESNGAVARDGAIYSDNTFLDCACHIEYEIAEEAMNFMSYVAEFSREWDEQMLEIWEE
ncbi:hypothetical protein CK203_084274 [Vitis vinifera]|uniref:Uncharacterized protein n=1 Tax=Vitis vinifera TaxID=29760 RepID=A0A438BMH7_VITVI|nr:hypothetical protein CK203_084274 [Vitis vinifera]